MNNRVYRGDAMHKGTAYPGEHEAIIDPQLWDRVHAILQESPRKRANNTRSETPALLKGLFFTESGVAMTPTSTNSRQLRLAYLAPEVLKRLTVRREALGVSLYDLCFLPELAWEMQVSRLFGSPALAASMG